MHVGVVVVSRTVLFGQVHGKLVQHFSGVALQRAEKSPATINHDKAKLAVIGQQGRQRLGGGAGCGLDEQGKGETFRPCHKAGRGERRFKKAHWTAIRTSVWNLLSQRYREVLIGLKGSKSMLTFFSLPSSVTMVPQYTTKPLGGTKGGEGQRGH